MYAIGEWIDDDEGAKIIRSTWEATTPAFWEWITEEEGRKRISALLKRLWPWKKSEPVQIWVEFTRERNWGPRYDDYGRRNR